MVYIFIRMVRKYFPLDCSFLSVMLCGLTFLFFNSCRLGEVTKKTYTLRDVFSREYNIIYTANRTLLQYESLYNNETLDSNLTIFSFPINTSYSRKLLDSVISKTQEIRFSESNSSFLEEAYFIKARAYYYNGEYDLANVYFTLLMDGNEAYYKKWGLIWKYLTLTRLGEDRAVLVDSLREYQIHSRKEAAFVYAIFADYDLFIGQISAAISHLEEALKFSVNQTYRRRWMLILSILYKHVGNEERAGFYKRKGEKRNATLVIGNHNDVANGILRQDELVLDINDEGITEGMNLSRDSIDARYEELFEHFQHQRYAEVLQFIEEQGFLFKNTGYQVKVDYLQAMSLGMTRDIQVYTGALQRIVDSYPLDTTITPIVVGHLSFINDNAALFIGKVFALDAYSSDSVKFEGQVVMTPWPATNRASTAHLATTLQQKANWQDRDSLAAIIIPDSGSYYYIINVESRAYNLNPSRYKIGQFNRIHYKEHAITHQRKIINNENQLIFVGPFQTFAGAKAYEKRIFPLLKEIMKLPEIIYNTFVIEKDSFAKLRTSDDIRAYQRMYLTTTKEF